jgi:hypothetical protein
MIATAQLSVLLPPIFGKEINFTVSKTFVTTDTISSEELEITKLENCKSSGKCTDAIPTHFS